MLMKHRISLLAIFLGASLLTSDAQILIDKRVTIQPIFISDGTTTANSGGHLYEAETDKIWSQAGIDVKFLSPVTIVNSTFYDIHSDPFSHADSLLALTQTAGNGANSDPTVVNLWFVNRINDSSSVHGFTLQTTISSGVQRPKNGISIANSSFTYDGGAGIRHIVAHELGHTLGLYDNGKDELGNVVAGVKNLMNGPTPTSIGDVYPDGSDLAQLTEAQIDRARSISLFALDLPAEEQYFFTPVPEPATWGLIAGVGLLGWGVARKLGKAKA